LDSLSIGTENSKAIENTMLSKSGNKVSNIRTICAESAQFSVSSPPIKERHVDNGLTAEANSFVENIKHEDSIHEALDHPLNPNIDNVTVISSNASTKKKKSVGFIQYIEEEDKKISNAISNQFFTETADDLFALDDDIVANNDDDHAIDLFTKDINVGASIKSDASSLKLNIPIEKHIIISNDNSNNMSSSSSVSFFPPINRAVLPPPVEGSAPNTSLQFSTKMIKSSDESFKNDDLAMKATNVEDKNNSSSVEVDEATDTDLYFIGDAKKNIFDMPSSSRHSSSSFSFFTFNVTL
jgi:hypothetical protein